MLLYSVCFQILRLRFLSVTNRQIAEFIYGLRVIWCTGNWESGTGSCIRPQSRSDRAFPRNRESCGHTVSWTTRCGPADNRTTLAAMRRVSTSGQYIATSGTMRGATRRIALSAKIVMTKCINNDMSLSLRSKTCSFLALLVMGQWEHKPLTWLLH